MKKIIVLLILLFVVTGCQVDYQIDIDKDLQITENVKMTGTTEFFNIYYKTQKINVLKMMLDTRERKETLTKNGYVYTIENEDLPYVYATKSYSSLDDYINGTIFYKQLFTDINFYKENSIITFKASGFIINDPENPERYNIKGLTIKIKTPYAASDNNADSYDSKTNTYRWVITDETLDKEILLKFDTNRLYINNLVMYISIAILIILVIVFILIVRKLIEKNKKNNRTMV